MKELTANLTSDLITVPCHVLGYTGKERISQTFEWDLSIATTEAPLDAPALVGEIAKLTFEHDTGVVRQVSGVIAECADMFDTESHSHRYRIKLVPRFWRSTMVRLIDIYMDLTLPELIQNKLEATGLELGVDFELRLSADYPKREFVVQYQESDLAFISRQCEHWGLSFFFIERDGHDVVVFTDDHNRFEPLANNDGNVPFVRRGEPSGVSELSSVSRMIPRSIVQRDYNYRMPGSDLTGVAKPSDGHLGAFYEYGGHFKSPEEASRIAAVRADELRSQRDVLQGHCGLVNLFAGCRLNVTGHAKGDIGLLISGVTHHGTQRSTEDVDVSVAAEVYRAELEAVRSTIAYRSPRVTPIPRIHGYLTGIIEGDDDGKYAQVDEEGRYRVRFLFDTAPEGERQASRPVRMMQPHAGPGYGMHFPLRGGVEVLIGFVGGDPDRPIIAGTVPNPQTAGPVRDENRERNIIRTGGGNEINIDDTDGSQRIKISVPTCDTVFQLGKENSPERGAALTTAGSSTSVAALGMGGVGSVFNSFSAFHDYRSSGDISTVAEGMTATKKAGAFIAGIAAAVEVAHQVISLARDGIIIDENIDKQQALDAGKKVKAAEQKCRACRLEAAKIANRLPAGDPLRTAFEADNAQKDADEAAYLALLGVMEDRNGIILANREGTNLHFAEVMQNDIEASLRLYDYGNYVIYMTGRDAAAWNALDPKPEGVTQAEWMENEKAKWRRPQAEVDELAQLEALPTPNAEQVARREALRASLHMEGGASQDARSKSAATAAALATQINAPDATDDHTKLKTQLKKCNAADACGGLEALRQKSFDANEHVASMMLSHGDALQGLRAAEITLENAEGLYSVIMGIIGVVQKIQDKVEASRRWLSAGWLARQARHRDKPPAFGHDWAAKAVTADMHPIHTLGSDHSMNLYGDDNVMIGGKFVTILGAQKDAHFGVGRVAVIAKKKVELESAENIQIAARNTLKMDADKIDIEARTEWKMGWKERNNAKGSLVADATGWTMNVGGDGQNACTLSLSETETLVCAKGVAAGQEATVRVQPTMLRAKVREGGSVMAFSQGVSLKQHKGGSVHVATGSVTVRRAEDSLLKVEEHTATLTSPSLEFGAANEIRVAAKKVNFGKTAIECQNLTVKGEGEVRGVVSRTPHEEFSAKLDAHNAELAKQNSNLEER